MKIFRRLRRKAIVYFGRKKDYYRFYFKVIQQQWMSRFEKKFSGLYHVFLPEKTFKQWVIAYTVLRLLYIWPFEFAARDSRLEASLLLRELVAWDIVAVALLCWAALRTYRYCMSHEIPWPTVSVIVHDHSRSLTEALEIYIDWYIYNGDFHPGPNGRISRGLDHHRENGPAKINISKNEYLEVWEYRGYKHRFDGPASIYRDNEIRGGEHYHLFEAAYSIDLFKQIVANKTHVEIAMEIYTTHQDSRIRHNVRQWLEDHGYHSVVENLDLMGDLCNNSGKRGHDGRIVAWTY